MINLDAIKARLHTAQTSLDMGKVSACVDAMPTDIAALIGEIARLRSVLDGPPICACGGTFTEVEYAADEGSPAAFGYHCQDCGWQLGNNGEVTERLTLRTNPQTERLIARIFGLEAISNRVSADIAALLAEVEAQRSELIALRRKVGRLEFDASVVSRQYSVQLHDTDRIVHVVSTKPAAAACFGAERLNVRNGRVIVTDLDSAATWTFEIETERKTLWYAREVVE